MTELIWEGKYDKDGRKVAPLRIALPFQTVETVNESMQERQRALDIFSTGRDSEWRNRLIWGDKKYVLPSLLPEFAGQPNLIYIDPPFDTGADFSFTMTIPDSETSFVKEPSVIEQKAYRDTWGKGLDSYLKWFYETATSLRDLLKEDGSLYVHLDWHVGHYAKSVLDEVFGSDNFRNEITWKRSAIATNVSSQWRNSHDVLLFFSRSAKNVFNVQYGDYSASSEKHYTYEDERGVFQPVPLLGSGKRTGETGKIWRGIDPNVLGKGGMHWLKKPSTLDDVDVLGWDFAFEINEVAKQQAQAANIHMRFVRIPREVLEKKAVEQGDIRFFELAALGVEADPGGKSVTLKLTDFVIPLDDVPYEVQKAITHWEQWIDYWAVDWDNRGDTFHNQWQTYRTRKDKALQKQTAYTYAEPGEYRVVVKVIDILGNDTTKTLKVEIR